MEGWPKKKGGEGITPLPTKALNVLCKIYRLGIYNFIRKLHNLSINYKCFDDNANYFKTN